MKRFSLGRRLLLAGSVATVIAILTTGLIISALFENYLHAQILSEQLHQLRHLTAQIHVGDDDVLNIGEALDPRFDQPLSGYYWQVDDGQEVQVSSSLWDQSLQLVEPEKPGTLNVQEIRLGHEAELLVTSWNVTVGEGASRLVTIAIATDLAPVQREIGDFQSKLALWLGMSRQETLVAVLFAAAPVATAAYTQAKQMGGDAPLTAALTTIQTAMALVTLPLWILAVEALFRP